MVGFFDDVRLVDMPHFPYRGGKAILRRSILRWCKLSGSAYVEPFAGRANLFFLMKGVGSFDSWHLNDVQTKPFFDAISMYDGRVLTTHSKEDAEKLHEVNDPTYLIMEPILTRCGGLGKRGDSIVGTRHNCPTKYRERLIKARECLRGVTLTDVDALDVVRRYISDPNAFVYLDPPYLNANVGIYHDGMVDRTGMIRLLEGATCKWLLSERDCPDLQEAFGPPMARIKNVPLNPNPRVAVRRYDECLWANYEQKPLVIDFGDRDRTAMWESHALLKQHRKIHWNDWVKLVPSRWSKRTKKIQFNRLACQPSNYCDGESVWIVE